MQNEIEPLTVGQITYQIKGLLETAFDDIWVVGETSGVNHARSGHCYLTLKDEHAQLPGVIWKSSMMRLKFEIENGQMLLCHGRVDVYPPQGKYQMIIDKVEPIGQGALELAFRQLHAKLEAEGLLTPEKKRPIPSRISRIALITSPTGAAIRDFLQILKRRTKRINVLLVPTRVQGEGASQEIARAIEILNASPERESFDCIVITRGGGSVEDLWTFNEEPLVRAVAKSKIPTISAVGHEIDVTLCDLAADFRALTPSEAAERIAPDDNLIKEMLEKYKNSLKNMVRQKIELAKQKISRFSEHPFFKFPKETLIYDKQSQLDQLEEKLAQVMEKELESARKKIAQHAVSLEALSPISILQRGYSLTYNSEQNLLRSVHEISAGQEIQTTLSDGILTSVVQECFPNNQEDL